MSGAILFDDFAGDNEGATESCIVTASKSKCFFKANIGNLVEECLLPPDDVKFWFQHENRRKGAEKANAKFRVRKAL